MVVSQVTYRFTVADYHRMVKTGILPGDARVELIEGEILQMSPISNRHNATVDHLTVRFIRTLGDRALVRTQGSVQLNDRSQPQPDLAILRWRADYYATRSAGSADALLLIEVCDTTLRYDRDTKVPLYARTGVPEVWLFDLRQRRILVYRQPTATGYRDTFEVRGDTPLSPLAFPDFVLTPDEIIP